MRVEITKTVKELRGDYRAILRRVAMSVDHTFVSPQAFTAMARLLLPRRRGRPSGSKWVEAAKAVTIRCLPCRGTGIYKLPNYRWETAACFRCEGKGEQNDDDRRRNYSHDHTSHKVQRRLVVLT